MKQTFFLVLLSALLTCGNAQNLEQSPGKDQPKVYELTGNLEVKDIERANKEFLKSVSPGSFSGVNELYELLRRKGTLRLKNATLTLLDIDAERLALSFHRLELINSTIYIMSKDIVILCNEFKQQASEVTSFTSEQSYAADGADGALAGAEGKTGLDGKSAGNIFVFVTDKIFAPSGNINFNLWGQHGGNGGNGKTGATGADGSRGRNCSDGGYQCRRGNSAGHPGRNGGKGGDAGDGGNGGDGGNLDFRLHGRTEPYSLFFRFSAEGGEGNYAGRPGEGGNGGRGGRPGSSNCGRICEPYSNRNGAPGRKGPGGQEGNKGTAGVTGQMTRGNFTTAFLRSFLTAWDDNDKKLFDNLEQHEVVQDADNPVTATGS